MEEYVPNPAPVGAEGQELIVAIWEEFRRLQVVITGIVNLELPTKHAAPDKPREGQIVKADGTDWDPGSGAGVYCFISGTWTKL